MLLDIEIKNILAELFAIFGYAEKGALPFYYSVSVRALADWMNRAVKYEYCGILYIANLGEKGNSNHTKKM